MSSVFLGLITASVIVVAVYVVFLVIEVKGFVRNTQETLGRLESSIEPTLAELRITLNSVHGLADNINDITDDVRSVSSSVREVGENVRNVSRLIGSFSSVPAVEGAAIRAGVKAGVGFALKSLLSRKLR